MRTPIQSLVLAACVLTHQLSAKTIELLNGRDLDGWVSIFETNEAAADTFSITSDGGLRVSGHPKGYLRTKEDYANYRLVVEWRWVDKPGNSGVLLHVQGIDKIWPHCVEAQLKHKRAGDIILMGMGSGGAFGDAPVAVTNPDRPNYAAKRKAEMSEKPPGEWNRYEIRAEGTTLELRVNGVLQNSATQLTLTSGTIGLQSEGAPIEFRKVTLERLGVGD